MAPKHQAPRGTRDLLPGDLARWQWIEDRAREVVARYGYREIRTPLFEDYELFARTSGESSDVVQKEMYRFQDLKGRDLALRPEGTAAVARAYLEHGMSGQSRVHRLWYMGPMFRYGRPQKGRYRQFHQIGAEILGVAAPAADIEMIALFVDLFEAWGFHDLVVRINSLGTGDTRRAYGEALRSWLAPVRAILSADSQARLESNPMRVLDSKDPRDVAILTVGSVEGSAEASVKERWDKLLGKPEASVWAPWFRDSDEAFAALRAQGPMPRMVDVLDAESIAHFDQVKAGLDASGIRWEIDHGLVRGLDYYTRTSFEVHDASLGAAQSALGGGGRYDGLIEELGGPSTPGVGFSIGLDRVALVLEQRGVEPPGQPADAYVVSMEKTRADALALVRELRRRFVVDFDLEGRGFGAQMKAAGKSGARRMVLLGEDEWARGEVVVKDLGSGEQTTIPRARLDEALAAPASAAAAKEVKTR